MCNSRKAELLKLALHETEDKLDRVVLRAIGDVEDGSDSEISHAALHHSRVVDGEVVHEDGHILPVVQLDDLLKELDEALAVD